MVNVKTSWCLAAAALAAAALAGCHDDHPGSSTTPPPTSTTVDFSTYAKQVFENGPNTTPKNLDGITFNFDVDDDPTAFDTLLM
jgi:hypothetical protein